MSKHYNLTMTDNNGKAVTTTNVSTEHPEELMRMLTLAGKTVEITPMDSGCGCDDSCGCDDEPHRLDAAAEYQATPANDELDLDDFSKKTANSISRQKKTLKPSAGDNPLEYSVNEDEIYEALIADFDLEESEIIKWPVKNTKPRKNTSKDTKGGNDPKGIYVGPYPFTDKTGPAKFKSTPGTERPKAPRYYR